MWLLGVLLLRGVLGGLGDGVGLWWGGLGVLLSRQQLLQDILEVGSSLSMEYVMQ